MVILNVTPLFIKAKCYEPHHDPVNVENFTRKTGIKQLINVDHLEKNDRHAGCKSNDWWVRKFYFYQ